MLLVIILTYILYIFSEILFNDYYIRIKQDFETFLFYKKSQKLYKKIEK